MELSLGRIDLGPLGSADVSPSFGVVESLLLTLVAGVGNVVAIYGARNLVGQHRLARFAAYEIATVAGLAVAVTASSLPILAAGWTAATLRSPAMSRGPAPNLRRQARRHAPAWNRRACRSAWLARPGRCAH